jgi:YggT family protein
LRLRRRRPALESRRFRRRRAEERSFMRSILWLIDTVITLYVWLLIAGAVLSWLIAFNVVNVRNPIVLQIADFLDRVTEPALRPIRRILPNLGGIDVSPIILLLGIFFLQRIIALYLYPAVF